MKTTLNKIKKHLPFQDSWIKLLKFLNKTKADDEELSLLTILESNGIRDAILALRAVDGFEREKRLMACDFAESVIHLANDERCINAIKVARNYANGVASKKELLDAHIDAKQFVKETRVARKIKIINIKTAVYKEFMILNLVEAASAAAYASYISYFPPLSIKDEYEDRLFCESTYYANNAAIMSADSSLQAVKFLCIEKYIFADSLIKALAAIGTDGPDMNIYDLGKEKQIEIFKKYL